MMKVVTAAVAGAAALVLAVGSPAHAKATHTQKCEAAKLKLVAKKASCELTIAAKAGTDFSKCVGAFGSAFGRVKTTCNGAEASLESQVDTFRAEITTALTPATSKCEAKKIKATAKKQACELAVDGTSILKGTSLAFGKCRTPFMNTFRKLEAKGGCGTAGDAGTIEGDVDAFVAGVFSEVNGGTGATTTTTTIVGGTTTTTLLGTVDTLDVVRVGDGTEDLSVDAADSVFIDRYHLDGSSGGASIALPTAASGSNHPFTQGGAETEGMLSRSADGRYLTLAGYAAVPGTAGVSVTDSATVQRVVARVDATGTVDTSTLLGTSAYTGNNIRGATTVDGSAFWTSGAGKTGGGVWYATLGGGTTTQVEISSISTIRAIEIFAGQLFGTGNNAGFKQVFTIGSGLPTTAGQTATTLPGMTDGSPFAFLLLDRNPSVPGLDTLYVADNSTLPIGGIQKWTFDGSNWTLTNTFTAGLSAPVRGLTGFVSGANVTLAATTNEATGNNLVLLVDDGSASPSATTIATAAATEQFRGVALALQ